jgi:hypothetical protein
VATDPVELLAARMVTAEARLDLYGLEGRYARTWDTGDAEGWAGLFTDEGVFELAAVGGDPGRRVEGREALTAFCRDYTALSPGLHLLHLPEFTLEGNRATSRLHFAFHGLNRSDPANTLQYFVAGYYDTSYVLYGTGWRIAERKEKAVTRRRAAFFEI